MVFVWAQETLYIWLRSATFETGCISAIESDDEQWFLKKGFNLRNFPKYISNYPPLWQPPMHTSRRRKGLQGTSGLLEITCGHIKHLVQLLNASTNRCFKTHVVSGALYSGSRRMLHWTKMSEHYYRIAVAESHARLKAGNLATECQDWTHQPWDVQQYRKFCTKKLFCLRYRLLLVAALLLPGAAMPEWFSSALRVAKR